MGAAGKRRENELLGMLEELRREVKVSGQGEAPGRVVGPPW